MSAMHLPTESELMRIRENYPMGCRIELIKIRDPLCTMAPGTKGTVIGVNALGDLEVDWDNGSTLSVILAIDRVRKL